MAGDDIRESGGNRRKPVARHMDPYGVRNDAESENGEAGGVIEGRNAVLEALRAGFTLDKVMIAKGETDRTLRHIASKARESGAAVVETDRRKLDAISVTHAHQGVIAYAAAAEYVELSDILEIARKKNEKPLIILCDGIKDPHNLGAIIRTAEAAGAHGVVIPGRRSAGLSATVAKASSGAVFHVAVARVKNMSQAISELQKHGVWVFGASAEGSSALWDADFNCPAAIVIGSEGSGVSRLAIENCDFTVGIPMVGKLSSLNASVSAAILLYEAVRQRKTAST